MSVPERKLGSIYVVSYHSVVRRLGKVVPCPVNGLYSVTSPFHQSEIEYSPLFVSRVTCILKPKQNNGHAEVLVSGIQQCTGKLCIYQIGDPSVLPE